jgi:hypothetical protein
MRLTNSIVAFAIAASLPIIALAGTRDPGVDHRQASQQARIHRGVSPGELNRGDAHRLAAEQRHVWRQGHAYESDAKLTQDERKNLHGDLSVASRSISAEKHDAERRY